VTAGPTAASTPTKSPPAVRLRRGAAPVWVPAAPVPDAPGGKAVVPADPGAVGSPAADPSTRSITLEALDPAVREGLTHAALDRLHSLADACEPTLTAPENLGAFMTLDHDGIIELELRPIAAEAGPIAVEERPLPQPLVDCLNEALWAQDWSGPSVPAGTELPVALTMRLSPPAP
jgi:hypothetical protein